MSRNKIIWLTPLLTVVLAACGGGGVGSSNSGGGDNQQKPDPVVVDLPIAYIKRVIPADEDGNPVFPNLFTPAAFNPGAELILKQRAAATASELHITNGVFPLDDETPNISNYDVKDLTTSFDGKKLLFSMRAPEIEDADDDEQPTWNIWEYDIAEKSLRRVIASDLFAEVGDDVSPIYLADGSILFASNRQTRTRIVLQDEGKPRYQFVTENDNDIAAFLLHRMNADGSQIEQISFNLSHDFQPLLLQNGRILFSRWDGTKGQANNENVSLYTANPDGTDVQYFFGDTSLNLPPETQNETIRRLFHPQELPDGRIASIYMSNETSLGGDMVFVDPRNTTEALPTSISPLPILLDPTLISIHGQFASLSPLFDGTNRLLVSWSSCRLLETATQKLKPCTTGLVVDGVPAAGHVAAPPLYGIWIYDLTANTQLPVVLPTEGYVMTEAVALENLTSKPDYIAPDIDPALATDEVGLIHIRSVYDMDGSFNRLGAQPATITYDQLKAAPADQRPARFLRILKPIPAPDNQTLDDQDNNIYGNLMGGGVNRSREIIGYVPIEPDGSVKAKVPSDISFTFEVVNNNGRRIQQRHPVWITLRPGETRECHGCHDTRNTTAVHGREGQEPVALNAGASTSGVSFPNTQRYDTLGAPLSPNMGETMAEFAARSTFCELVNGENSCGVMKGPGQERNETAPTVDIIYKDVWAAIGATSTPAFDLSYNKMIPGAEPEDIPAPVNSGCRLQWHSGCRTVINYEYHIQPMWEQDRGDISITDGALAFTGKTCLDCHSEVGADAMPRVPAGNLHLGRMKINANQPMRSYDQLVNGRNRQLLVNGTPTELYPFCEWMDDNVDIPACSMPTATNVNGDLICSEFNPCPFEEVDVTDINGVVQTILVIDTTTNLPIPRNIPTPDRLPALVSRGGANASMNFFNRFTNAGSSHYNLLNEHERRLISEWLDLNANYYNNPFEMSIQN